MGSLIYDNFDEPMSAESKKWQSESDARTLALAGKIKGDQDRFSAASDAALKMAAEAKEEIKALTNVAKNSKVITYENM